jgi:hypothetical protein
VAREEKVNDGRNEKSIFPDQRSDFFQIFLERFERDLI